MKENEIVNRLSSVDSDAKLTALRSLKNMVIGDKRKKLSFVRLGAVQLLAEILGSDSDPALLIQAAATVRRRAGAAPCPAALI